jgi:hypothetical protein
VRITLVEGPHGTQRLPHLLRLPQLVIGEAAQEMCLQGVGVARHGLAAAANRFLRPPLLEGRRRQRGQRVRPDEARRAIRERYFHGRRARRSHELPRSQLGGDGPSE